MSDAGRSPSPPKQGWLTTLPGVLTTVGTFIAVVTAFFTLIAPLWSLPEIKFSVTPTELRQGGKVTLDWAVTNARQVKILPDIGNVGLTGRRSVQPQKTTTYTLIAKRFFSEAIAEYEVHVAPEEQPIARKEPTTSRIKPAPDTQHVVTPDLQNQVGQSKTISFSNYADGLLLRGDEFINHNIQQIKAIPSTVRCQNVRAAILPAGSYRSQYSFLTTADSNDLKRCNTVPLAIIFIDPIREVIVRFGGANTPYELAAYRKDGTIIGRKIETALSYAYADYEINLTSETANIAKVEFGYETALTMIRDIEFRQ